MDLTTYLYFDGNCEQAFKLYEQVLGGRIVMMLKYSDAPTDQPTSEGTANRIMHARLLAGRHILMGSDTPAGRFKRPQGFSVAVGVDTPEEAERIFGALAKGGIVHHPLSETFFAHKFGMLEDRFGVAWLVNCEKRMGEAAITGDSKPFVISRTLDAPRDVVWRAFTDAEAMRGWWGPRGAEIVASKMDLRPGGTYLYGMRNPDGKVMWGKMVYREIEKPTRIHFINSFSDENGGVTRHPIAPTWPLELLSTFTFAEMDDRTTLTVTWEPLDPSPDEQAAFDQGHASMTSGWTGTLDRLETYLARPKAG
ncbi:MAG: SRPBCC domain-containing protein [Hyphomicrobiaceae bacterium]